MKETGITRRIDELGRIVIPKEIRKNLKIRTNDELSININDNNIVLSKYEKVSSDEVLKVLVKVISKCIDKVVLITSKERVIVCSDKKYNELEFSNNVINKLEKREELISLIPTEINLFNEIIKCSYIVKPFFVNCDLIGSVIILSASEMLEDVFLYSDIIKGFLEKYLED